MLYIHTILIYRWYNLQDVMPLLEGIEKMTLYFKSRNLDLGKDGISLPGLALKDLFSEIDTFFSLPYAKDEDMYHLLKSNIVGTLVSFYLS